MQYIVDTNPHSSLAQTSEGTWMIKGIQVNTNNSISVAMVWSLGSLTGKAKALMQIDKKSLDNFCKTWLEYRKKEVAS